MTPWTTFVAYDQTFILTEQKTQHLYSPSNKVKAW